MVKSSSLQRRPPMSESLAAQARAKRRCLPPVPTLGAPPELQAQAGAHLDGGSAWTAGKLEGDAPVRVGSVCGGLGSECMALDSLGVPHKLVFAVEEDERCRVWLRDHQPSLPKTGIYRDVTGPAFEAAPSTDLFVAGLACQPYSGLELGLGFDCCCGLFTKVLEAIMNHIERCKPRCVLLEHEVKVMHRHPRLFTWMLDRLELMHEDEDGLSCYRVEYKVLNARMHGGLPHERARLFIVAWKPCTWDEVAPFPWPSYVPWVP